MDITPELIQAKSDAEFGILALPGVIGVAIGQGESQGQLTQDLAVVVYVQDASQAPTGIPEQIGGVSVCTVERHIEPCGFPDGAQYPDVRGGIKVTYPLAGSGTVGVVVEDASNGEPLGLSCRHVVGDPGQSFPYTVWQPTNPPLVGTVSPDDSLGAVVRSDYPHTSTPTSPSFQVGTVDAAVFRLDEAQSAGRSPSKAIAGLDPGQPNLVSAVTSTLDLSGPGPALHSVRKRGYASGPTTGTVVRRLLTVNWQPGGPNALLMNQLEIINTGGVFCQHGDSGSLVLDATDPTAVGLLWGQDSGGTYAPAGTWGYASPIPYVENQLGVSTVWA